MSESSLMELIEGLREQMIQLALEKETMLDSEVIAISQQLDVYLLRWQRLVNKKTSKPIGISKSSA